ncbi:MAG TPA: hydrogenase maturation nickel metallochaperone HypA [Azospirillaceae bacterium]|nr:hydrogenase maturation nickel metallochaperone HypA [Azospirillaceae bacterium]
MHEMSLTESMREVIGDQARVHGFTRVKTVWLEVGPFSNVEVEALRFCWDVVMKDSPAEGAVLEIIRPEGRGLCLGCAAELTVTDRTEPCPKCGGVVFAQGGDDLRIKELEVE